MITEATPIAIQSVQLGTGITVPEAQLDMDNTWVIRKNYIALALVGAPEAWEGLGQVWAIFDRKRCEGLGRFILRESRKALEMAMTKNNYRQMRVFAFSEHDVKWNSLCGFEIEGIWGGAAPDGSDVAVMIYNRRH